MSTRLVYLDYSYPEYISYYQFLIPAAQLSNNFGAPWKPYSVEVMILSTNFVTRCISQISWIGVDLVVSEYSGDHCDL